MKKLVLRCSILTGLILASLYSFCLCFEQDFTDRFYSKFTSEANSLVVGSSRALLGVDPQSVSVACQVQEPFLNFAFTMRTSPYGEVYFDAIMKKINTDSKDGLFILEVSPLNISAGRELSERELVLNRMHVFNANPNVEYILRQSIHPLYLDFLFPKMPSGTQRAYSNGWVENMHEADEASKQKKRADQLKEYAEIFATYNVSDYRVLWLKKTISALEEHGTVVILRVPVGEQMLAMEEQYFPAFDSVIGRLSLESGAYYVNMVRDTGYRFADLHHMESESAKEFSRKAGAEITRVLSR